MDLAAWTPRALSVLRIVTGLLFLEHGTGKLLGFPPSDHAAPTLFSLIGVQGVLELVGGFLILIGLFTRPVTRQVAIECSRALISRLSFLTPFLKRKVLPERRIIIASLSQAGDRGGSVGSDAG